MLITRHAPAPPAAALPLADLTPADVRTTDVVQLTPLSTAGKHATFMGVKSDGQKVFVKHAALRNFMPGPLSRYNPQFAAGFNTLFPHLDRFQDMTETMLSHFLNGYFESRGRAYAGITYEEVVGRDPVTGKNEVCLAAPLVEHLGTLEDVPAASIANPRDAIEGTLLRGLLLGDCDVSFNASNTAVVKAAGQMSDGTPTRAGEALLMDFGEGGHEQISFLGVPFGSTQLMAQFPQEIRPAMESILKLDRDEVHRLVEVGGQHVTGWTPALTDHFTDILDHNLSQARERWASNPGWFSPEGSRNPLRGTDHLALKKYLFAIPSTLSYYVGLKQSGILAGIPDNHALAERILPMQSQWPSQRQDVSPA